MKYGIMPQQKLTSGFKWRFDTLDEAKDEARELSTANRCDVVVFTIEGTYKTATVWEVP